MKPILIAIALTLSLPSWGQEKTSAIRIAAELTGGYQYALLDDFNDRYIRSGLYDHELHSGWHAGSSLNLRWNRFLSTSLEIGYRSFHVSDFREDLWYYEPFPGGSSFVYDERDDTWLRNLDAGVRITIYLDQLKPGKEGRKFNVGLDLSGRYVVGQYKHVYTLYKYRTENGSERVTTTKLNYGLISLGPCFVYNVNKGPLQALVVRCGWNQAVGSTMTSTSQTGALYQLPVDFSGFYTRIGLILGGKR